MGAYVYDLTSYKATNDIFAIVFLVFGSLLWIGHCGFSPYKDFEEELRQIEELK